MKTPIEPSDIRAGDLIRLERVRATRPAAFEYRACSDGDKSGWFELGDTYYLLDRPTPAVDLPKTVTLGTLGWRDDGAIRDRCETALWELTPDGKRVISESSSVPVRLVTGFTPILTHHADETAVPTAALDELRESRELPAPLWQDLANAIDKFLAAIDGANQ